MSAPVTCLNQSVTLTLAMSILTFRRSCQRSRVPFDSNDSISPIVVICCVILTVIRTRKIKLYRIG